MNTEAYEFWRIGCSPRGQQVYQLGYLIVLRITIPRYYVSLSYVMYVCSRSVYVNYSKVVNPSTLPFQTRTRNIRC